MPNSLNKEDTIFTIVFSLTAGYRGEGGAGQGTEGGQGEGEGLPEATE